MDVNLLQQDLLRAHEQEVYNHLRRQNQYIQKQNRDRNVSLFGKLYNQVKDGIKMVAKWFQPPTKDILLHAKTGDLFLQRKVDEGFTVSLKTYLLASEQGNFSKGAVGTALGEWNHVGIIVDMATSPFDYRKKNVNNDFETEDALRNQCTKYVIYGTVDGVMAERLDILLDRNMMKYHLCALKPLEDSSSIGGIKDGISGEPSSPSPTPSPTPSSPSSPISQKYNSRSSKSSKSSKSIKKGNLRIDTGDDDDDNDDDDDDDGDEVDVLAEDFHRSAMLKAIQLYNEVEDNVDSLLRTRLQWLCARALFLEIDWSLCAGEEGKGFDFRHGQRGRESIIIDEVEDNEDVQMYERDKEALRQNEEDHEQLFTLMGKNILERLTKFMTQPTGEDVSEALQMYYGLDPENKGYIPASLAITAFESMMNKGTDDQTKHAVQQIIDSIGTIHGNGNVSMEIFLRAFLKVPSYKLSNEIDLTQVIMGEFVANAYHVCGICTAISDKAYFVPTSYLHMLPYHHKRQHNGGEKQVLEYKLYYEAKLVDLQLDSKYIFGEEVPLDIDTDPI